MMLSSKIHLLALYVPTTHMYVVKLSVAFEQ